MSDVDAGDISARVEASEPVVIKLRSPIKFGSRTIDEITVRPVKAKHMRSIKESDGPLAVTLSMASKLTGETREIIDELEGHDLRDVLQAVNGFFLAIQETGAKSSES